MGDEDSAVVVTIENVHFPDEDMKIAVPEAGQTSVSQLLQHYVSNQKTRWTMAGADVCLFHDGRLLQSHETLCDILGKGGRIEERKTITFDLICTTMTDTTNDYAGQMPYSFADEPHGEPLNSFSIDPVSLVAAKSYFSNNLSSSISTSLSSSHTQTPPHLAALQETFVSLLDNQQQGRTPSPFTSSSSSAFTPSPHHGSSSHQYPHHQLHHPHDITSGGEVRGNHAPGRARGGAMGGAGAPPLAQLLQQDEVGEALPRLIRIPVLFRIAFALMLFGRDYETHVLAAASLLYYFYEVGLWGFLYRRFFPQLLPPLPPTPPVQGQGAVAAGVGQQERLEGEETQMQEHEQERGAEDGEGNENAPLSPAQGAPQRRTGAGGGREVEGRRGWLGGVGHLIRRLQALAAVPPGPSLLPRGGGAAMDVLALLVAFFGSLVPSWNVDQ